MNRAQEKSQRLLQIEKLLWAHPEGLTRAEIARQLGVNRSTITKYLDAGHLPPGVYDDEFDGNKLKFDRSADLTKTTFNLHEVLTLHLAARLLATRTDKQNPHAASALRKLAVALQRLDKNISQHMLRAADIMTEDSAFRDPVYLDVLEKLTEAWSAGRKVKVTHQMDGGRIFEYTFAPYFIESYAVGQTTHVFGWREPPNALRTFKIERLRSVQILHDRYEIPPDFDPSALLRDAWGIWYSEGEPVEVVLRFHPRVAGRVQESRWQRGQQVELQPDGYLIWRARVAEVQEMMPWIRGWGADCEVLAPRELREDLKAELDRMLRVYDIDASTSIDPTLQRAMRCWGKTGKTDTEFHPAVFHMVDVANVAAVLLSDAAPPRFRRVLSLALDTKENDLVDWVPWLIALHDIGKITLSFQAQNAAQKARLLQEGFSFATWAASNDKPHSIFSQAFVEDLLPQLAPSLGRAMQRAAVEMIGGHHGAYQKRDIVKRTKDALAAFEPPEWQTMRAAAEAELREYFLHCDLAGLPKPENVSTAVLALSGFTILCDWIGSDSRYFSPQADMPLDAYVRQSKRRAQQALQASGLLADAASLAPTTFASLFADVAQPRPLQLAIDAIPLQLLQQPCLVIIEAPTGEGKTEAALALAHTLAQANLGDEFFYALPTMATSNQMFGRLQTHLQSRLDVGAQIKLVHGQSFLVEDELRIEPLSNGGAKEQGYPRGSALQWFNGKKRALLAPFGVGTIDQAELAALNTRHAALRMFGLAGKVVIVDEVHAYDTYMTAIIEQLLRWLAALNTSVILLSATLPLTRRKQLAQAYGVELSPTMDLVDAYPSLLVLSRGGTHQACPPAWQASRRIALNYLYLDDDQVDAKAAWLLDQVRSGGCACWITNTVKRAQCLFAELQKLAPNEVDLALLHSQFPLEERQQWEAEIAGKYGPQGVRPQKGIVIGTQVLEQSLDLDFDVMVSDLAPVDLLLQRAGRLHRHNRPRHDAHQEPWLWVNLHREDQPLIPPKADCAIYTEYLLRQSWETLAGRDAIHLPADYRPLIEAVYDAPEPAADAPLREAWEKLQRQEGFATQEATIRLLPEPDPATPFSYRTTQNTFEEDENSAAWIVAQTRLGDESLNIIPLEVHDGVGLLPDGTRVPLAAEADVTTQIKLLRRNLRISQHQAIQAVRALNEMPCPLFKNSPLLKNYFLLPLNNGKATITQDKLRLSFTLHPRIGLIIEREKL
ncbi:MAG: CRISPR-associated helicase Cas3' [Caldilineaceae bacterium]